MGMSKRVLVTGGAGFCGSHLIEHILKNTDWSVVCLDRLDVSGNLNRIGEVLDVHTHFKPRFKFVYHDLKAEINNCLAAELLKPNLIFHLAASSHVDDSIKNPLLYVQDNVIGTLNILNYARSLDCLDFMQMFSCYDEQTKILTKRGILAYDEIKEGDIVFTINPNSMELEEQPIKRVIIQDYSGEMIHFDNRMFDMMVTPSVKN
jgi:nucleoside-diphosphate-sugar epimerase